MFVLGDGILRNNTNRCVSDIWGGRWSQLMRGKVFGEYNSFRVFCCVFLMLFC